MFNKQDYLEMLIARLKREGADDALEIVSKNSAFIEKSWNLNVSIPELAKQLRRTK